MKERADRKMKAMIQMWSDVVKGLKIEDELETADSVEHFDSEEPYHLKAKRRRSRKSRKSRMNLELSLTWSVEIQAQHGPNRLLRTGSDEDRLVRPGLDRSAGSED